MHNCPDCETPCDCDDEPDWNDGNAAFCMHECEEAEAGEEEMRKPKQYVVVADVDGYRMSICFLTTATTGREAIEKTQRHLDAKPYQDGNGDRQGLTVKNRSKVATERDLRMFKDFPESILG